MLAIDILVAALFTASLRLITGTGGITSFGHAAYFGIGAYASALAATHGYPFVAALALAPVAASVARARVRRVLRALVRHLPRDADARVRADRVVDRAPVGRGHRRVERHRRRLAAGLACGSDATTTSSCWRGRRHGAGRARLHRVHAVRLRAARRAAIRRLRAAASGIDVRARRIKALAIAGGFAGLAGGLFAYLEGRHFARHARDSALGRCAGDDAARRPERARSGPLLGAAAFTWLQDALARATEYWRAGVGVVILLIVSVFPVRHRRPG